MTIPLARESTNSIPVPQCGGSRNFVDLLVKFDTIGIFKNNQSLGNLPKTRTTCQKNLAHKKSQACLRGRFRWIVDSCIQCTFSSVLNGGIIKENARIKGEKKLCIVTSVAVSCPSHSLLLALLVFPPSACSARRILQGRIRGDKLENNGSLPHDALGPDTFFVFSVACRCASALSTAFGRFFISKSCVSFHFEGSERLNDERISNQTQHAGLSD